MYNYLAQFANETIADNINIYYTFDWSFDRGLSKYGTSSGQSNYEFVKNDTYYKELAGNLTNQISCTKSGDYNSTFPANITITQKTNQQTSTLWIPTGDSAMNTNFTLSYFCDETGGDMTENYWELAQIFNSNAAEQDEVDYL